MTVKFRPGQGKLFFVLPALVLSTLLVLSCAEPNNLPVISKLQAEKGQVLPSGKSMVTCAASDTDGDSLSYAWTATGGDFSGAGSAVTWTAPDRPGTYDITVTVTDSRGGEASEQLGIDVLTNNAPVIEKLSAEPSVVVRGENVIIECIASDADGDPLTYEWSTVEGNISGQGATVTWTAPDTCDEYVVKVTVADENGSEVSGELSIRVKNPG